MKIKLQLYHIDEYFNKKATLSFSSYIKNEIESMGEKLYKNMKEYYKSKNKEFPTQHYMYLLFYKDEVIGYRYFYFNDKKKFAELFAIGVSSEFRKNGYAKMMIVESINFLISKKIKRIKVPLVLDKKENCFILNSFYSRIILDYPNIEWNIEI